MSVERKPLSSLQGKTIAKVEVKVIHGAEVVRFVDESGKVFATMLPDSLYDPAGFYFERDV